jgi:hypothetical protein
LKFITAFGGRDLSVAEVEGAWALARKAEKEGALDPITSDACSRKNAKRLVKLLPRLSRAAALDASLASHVHARDESCAALGMFLEKVVLSDRKVPLQVRSHEEARTAARKVHQWSIEDVELVKGSISRLNQSGKAVTSFFHRFFDGNFLDVFCLETNEIHARTSTAARSLQRMPSQNQNILLLMSLNAALDKDGITHLTITRTRSFSR